MVTRDDVKRAIKRRVLLQGRTGTGKTRACMKLAAQYAREGRKVLYVDLWERGAALELDLVAEGLSDEELGRISYVATTRERLIIKMVKQSTVDLIILDPVHYVNLMCREGTRDQLIRNGDLTDNDELEGFQFSRAGREFDRVFEVVLNSGADVVCTRDPSKWIKTDKQGNVMPGPLNPEIDGLFDLVIKLTSVHDKDGRTWYAEPTKVRGGKLKKYVKLKMKSKMTVLEVVPALEEKENVPIEKGRFI